VRAIVVSLVVTVLLLLAVFDDPSTVGGLLLGIAAATLAALGAVDATVGLDRTRVPDPPAEEQRLRGRFRRQHRPDAPGRPMPRAPGSMT
jgi:hypothetical protein